MESETKTRPESGPPVAKVESKAASAPVVARSAPPPWQQALDESSNAPGYEQLAFQSFEEAFGKPGRDDLTPWFETTTAAGFRISKVPSQYGQSAMVEGIGRLKSPWPEGAVLRLQLENFDGLKMHFWNRSAGVTLVYADEGNRWTAYKTTREQNEPTPKTSTIAGADDDRCRRTGFRFGGPVELRFVNDELLLSRGDIVLLAAPFDGPPTDTFVDGRATIHGIALARTKDAPISPIALKPIELRQLAGLQAIAECDQEAFDELSKGPERERAYRLVERALDTAQAQGVPFEKQLAALNDAARLCFDLGDSGGMKTGILSRYVQLGLWAADHENLPAWSSVRRAFHSVPVRSPAEPIPDLGRPIRWELVQRAYDRQPQQTLDFIERLRFFHEHRTSALVDWAQWLASSAAGPRVSAQPKDSWRELLVEELSKEAYNAVTELKAVLDGQSWEEAARLIAALRPQAAHGVAPAINDSSLIGSLPVAIANVWRDFPQVAAVTEEKFSATAKLRIAEAIRSGDAASLDLATVQFASLPAVADAQLWLADRALVEGRFGEAIRHYERAVQLGPEFGTEVAPKIRLAAAMNGREIGEPAGSAAQFGDATMSPARFEALISEMREKYPSESSDVAETAVQLLKPGVYRAEMRGQFDGPAGERLQDEVAKRTNDFRVSWVDRQMAVAVAGGVMYVSNRFHVAAYDSANGRRLWQSKALSQTMQRAQDWPLVPMRPLVHRGRVFVRLLYSANPILACFDKATGELVWTAETSERESFVSDPLVINDQLIVLSLTNGSDQTAQLRQLVIDLQTGDGRARHDLVRLRGSWWSRRCCQVTAFEDGLVASLGGVTLATTADGEVRWIRKPLAVPAEEDPRWILQMQERPLVVGSRLFVAQPGVRTVECLDVATGRREWQAVLPEVVGIVGLAGDVLVVRTESDVRGLDGLTGTTRWRFEAGNVVGFPLCDDESVLMATSEAVDGSARQRIRFAWLSAADGRVISSSAVEGLNDADPRLGPIVPVGRKTFAFFGRGQQEVTREVVEITGTPSDEKKSRAATGGG
jgi:outer membrane protein assembly factor BamB